MPANLPSPPTLSQGESGGFADHATHRVQSDSLPLIVVYDFADNILAQQISQITGVGQVNISGQQKPQCASRSTRTGWPRWASGWRTFAAHRQRLGEHAQGHLRRDDTELHRLHQRPVAQRSTVERRDRRPTSNGAPIRVRDIGVAIDAPENTSSPRGRMPVPRRRQRHPRIGRAIAAGHDQAAGRERHRDGRPIKAALPNCRPSIPQAIEVNILSDRTQTIRASVHDVEFTLVLHRHCWSWSSLSFCATCAATLIPSVTVPLALMGTAAIMYLAGFSLDNLSLMALTISLGFVVDDAIVMLENIYRHVEGGHDADGGGATRERAKSASPSSSISVSLVAVFIPLLLMGGIVGRSSASSRSR